MGSITSKFIVAGITVLFAIVCFADDFEQDYFVFADVTGIYRYNLNATSALEGRDSHTHIVFFHTLNYQERISSLVEYVFEGEHRSLERLQFGTKQWRLFNFSIGRGHIPLSKWNTDYHHGAHLETSISRPNVTDKMVPRHSSGLEFNGEIPKQQGYLSWDLNYGLAPKLGASGLVDYDLLETDDGHKNQYSIRVTNKLDDAGHNAYGFYLGKSTFASELSGISLVDQQQTGLFANWSIDRLKLIGEIVHLRLDIQSSNPTKESFASGYLQGEWRPHEKLAWFGRVEHTSSSDTSVWLPLVPDAVRNRTAVGLRYDFRSWQAVTVEFARTEKMNEEFNSFTLRWSGVLE